MTAFLYVEGLGKYLIIEDSDTWVTGLPLA